MTCESLAGTWSARTSTRAVARDSWSRPGQPRRRPVRSAGPRSLRAAAVGAGWARGWGSCPRTSHRPSGCKFTLNRDREKIVHSEITNHPSCGRGGGYRFSKLRSNLICALLSTPPFFSTNRVFTGRSERFWKIF